VLGVSVLATVFTSHGGYGSPEAFVHGLTPALWIGSAVLAVGAVIPLLLPFSTRASAQAQAAAQAVGTAPDQPAAQLAPVAA
jgi:hypothetical protein